VAEADAKVDSIADIFAVTSATAVYVTLKHALKEHYGLSSEKCQAFDPSVNKMDHRISAKEDGENEKCSFPLESFYELSKELSNDPEKNVVLLKKMIQQEPVDVNQDRAIRTLEKLEGKGKKKGGGKGRKKKVAEPDAMDVDEEGDEGMPPPKKPDKAPPTPKGKGGGKGKKRARESSSEDDDTSSESESEEPKPKKGKGKGNKPKK